LLREKSLIQGAETSAEPKRVPIISFSSPYPVTPDAIQLYAEQAHIRLDARGMADRTLDGAERTLLASDIAVVTSSLPHTFLPARMGDELIAFLDGNPEVCLVVSLPLRGAREVRIYRHSDHGCGASAPDTR
jgi:hypothetical protein